MGGADIEVVVDPALDEVAFIRPEERDYELDLQTEDWGSGLSDQRWTPMSKPHRHLVREFAVHTNESSKLHESIVPFPSCPIFGINRNAEYSQSLPKRPNLDTVRVLRRPEAKSIDRLFILHNGLNESDDMRFYYRLADWILREQEFDQSQGNAACLIVPFPGHLTHFPFHGAFSETPLSRYLNDSGELFRQFLRYMVTMKWLLAMVADSGARRWMVGGNLMRSQATASRQLANEIQAESSLLHKCSDIRLAITEKMRVKQGGTKGQSPFKPGSDTTETQIKKTIELLRRALMRPLTRPKPLSIHVVGYSLGGFVAQSAFFAWPQVVSSCTTICSGGAISALSPTAFAHPEEWQSVLHSLRPELGNSMLQGRLGDDRRKDAVPVPVTEVAGMPLQSFGYFQRIFEQVFLQEDRGSYKERLSEYGLRMLFVSGGEDPIVPPANILDASPREGITMLSIAGMTHFLNQEPRGSTGNREKEQRDFWLPEAGKLIARAAIHSEKVHKDERAEATEYRVTRVEKRRMGSPLLLADDDLAGSEAFESSLDWVLDVINEAGGWLLVCRNSLPAAFIRSYYFERWGEALHHHDVKIQQYALGLRRRTFALKVIRPRLTLLIPNQLRHWFVDLTAQFDAHSDAPSGRMTTADQRDRIWKGFVKEWWPYTREFNGGRIDQPHDGSGFDGSKLADKIAAADERGVGVEHMKITYLPDVWIGIDPTADSLLSTGKREERENAHKDILEGVEKLVSDPEPLEKDLQEERIRIVRVSGAEFNPRYRGRIEKSPKTAVRLLTQCAASLVRSSPMADPTADEPSEDLADATVP